MRFRTKATLRAATISVALVVLGSGCTGDRPTEADLPPEADLAYPGAIEVDRNFDDGESGTYIDGGSAERSASLDVTYEIAEVDRQEIFDWYETELVNRGWTVTQRSSSSMNIRLESDTILYGAYLSAAQEAPSEYSFTLLLSPLED